MMGKSCINGEPLDGDGFSPVHTTMKDGQPMLSEFTLEEPDGTGVAFTVDHELQHVSMVSFNDGSFGTNLNDLIRMLIKLEEMDNAFGTDCSFSV